MVVGDETKIPSQRDTLCLLPWMNLASFAVNIAVTSGVSTAVGSIPPVAQFQSQEYHAILTLADSIGSIWTLLLVLQGAWALLQLSLFLGLLPSGHDDTTRIIQYYYATILMFQAAWTLVVTTKWMALSTIFIAGMAWRLAAIAFSLKRPSGRGHETVAPSQNLGTATQHHLLLELPMALHFGWILMANVAPTTLNVPYHGALGGLVGLVVVSGTLVLRRAFVAIPLVASWAFFGIYSQLLEGQQLNDSDMMVRNVQLVLMTVVSMLVVSLSQAVYVV